jgi:hypothetical protein
MLGILRSDGVGTAVSSPMTVGELVKSNGVNFDW